MSSPIDSCDKPGLELPLSNGPAQNLNDALAKKKKELVTARLARTRAVGAGPAGPRSPCPAARAARMRSRHVQVATR